MTISKPVNETERTLILFGRLDTTAAAVPDTTLSAEDREIGGLELLMVKKFMDTVEYAYHDGLNILTLEKQTTKCMKR